MNDRSHLVATPIVDSTGKQTTVYRKGESGSSIPALPAPRGTNGTHSTGSDSPSAWTPMTFFRDRKERKQLATEITDKLWTYDERMKRGYVDGGAGKFIAKIKDVQYLRDLKTVSDLVTHKELSRDMFNDGRDRLITMLFDQEPTDKEKNTMRAIAKYSGWMRENNVRLRDFAGTYEALVKKVLPSNSSDGTVPNIEAHCQAFMLFETQRLGRYVRNSDFGNAVHKYPDKVDQLGEYVKERGLKNFNEDDFLNYLEGGVVREGWL